MLNFIQPPELSDGELEVLGEKKPTEGYVLQHGGYDNHEYIFPVRPGPRPFTTHWEPHEQLNQLGHADLWDELLLRLSGLAGVRRHESQISVVGAQGFSLEPDQAAGPAESYIIEREFVHIHPSPDSSLHLQLPLDLVVFAVSAGWAEIHTTCWFGDAPANSVMLFSPRNSAELEVIWLLAQESYRFATGAPSQFVVQPRIRT